MKRFPESDCATEEDKDQEGSYDRLKHRRRARVGDLLVRDWVLTLFAVVAVKGQS